MALLSIILGIFLDRNWSDLHKWQQWGWFSSFNQWIQDKTGQQIDNPTVRYLSVLAIPVLVMLFLQGLSSEWLSPVSFVFAFVVFVYCLGPLDIEQQFEQLINTLNEKDAVSAQTLANKITSEPSADNEIDVDKVTQSTMNQIIESLFGVIFWFVILGPVGAVLYRLSQHLKHQYTNDPVFSSIAERMVELLNWLPERFLSISFAITGHFEAALSAYKENKETDRTQQFLLSDICNAALEGNDKTDKAAYLMAFRGLVLRSLVFWLTTIALLTLLGWN